MKTEQRRNSKGQAQPRQSSVTTPVSIAVGPGLGEKKPPEASVDSSISFRISAPAATNVCVAGSFNNWNPSSMPLSQGPNGEWTVRTPLKPGEYEYRFVVDGVWQEDPAAPASLPNPFGERNSLVVVK